MLAIALVTYASWMYAQNPVVNRGRLDQLEGSQASDEVRLVSSETTEV